ncbi:MAG: GspH/FimT family pseudopilin [Burkholderiaceae bacterium]
MMKAQRARGFTLIEMLTVVSVLAVVAAIAAPGMRSFAAGQRVKALAYDITADLLLARSEALKRNINVSITPVTGTNWASGWTVDAGAVNISSRNAANESLTFTGAPASITFGVNGRVVAPTDPLGVRMTVESDAATNDFSKRCIELDLSGRARSSVGKCPPP